MTHFFDVKSVTFFTLELVHQVRQFAIGKHGDGISKAGVRVGLGVTCSPRDPRFVGANPSEVDGFFQDIKILSTSPFGRDFLVGSLQKLTGGEGVS